MRSAMKTTSLMSWLTMRIEDGLRSAADPDVEHLGAQALGGERVDLAEGLVHEEDLGVDREGAGHADALLHAAGELARVGLLEAGEADDADGVLRALRHVADARGPSPSQHGLDVLRRPSSRERARSSGRRSPTPGFKPCSGWPW